MMRFVEYKLPNAAAHVITVSSSAGTLESFIDTAAGSSSSLPTDLDYCIIAAEDGNLRYLADGNTPTAGAGVVIWNGEKKELVGVPVKDVRLIRKDGSDVTVSVRVGWARK